ncbi:MAG: alpha/beta hydrolase [Leptospiraceae bacterium]|nr:alpha/beta hydrolase [Leptospiraceae bacterium]MCP5500734.1 alpha/beta hydrolase [Leptospiraceae bacterium]
MSLMSFALKNALSLSRVIFARDIIPRKVGKEVLDSYARFVPVPETLRMQEDTLAGEIPALWVWDRLIDGTKVLYYLHGGGYHLGSPITHRNLAYRIASTIKARAIIPDYRKAPLHTFPAPIEDAVRGYEALLNRGIRPEDIVIGGDSAGGGLAIATLISLRDRKLPLPASSFVLSPWVDLECKGESTDYNASLDPWLNLYAIKEFSRSYLNGTDPAHPLASPINADLSGLPPLLIQVGSHEILLDDSKRLHARAKECGLESKITIWDEMIHVFQAFQAVFPEAKLAVAEIGEFVEQMVPVS